MKLAKLFKKRAAGETPAGRVDAPGVQTSEFWVLVAMGAAAVLTELNGTFENHYLAVAAVGGGLVYKLFRFWLKLKRSDALEEVEDFREEVAESVRGLVDAVEGLRGENTKLKAELKVEHKLRAHPVSQPPSE